MRPVDDPPVTPTTGTGIRGDRTRAFLVTHMIMSAVLTAMLVSETIFHLQADQIRVAFSRGAVGLLVVITLAGWLAFKRGMGLSYIIPVMLSLDSLVTMLQLYQEGDFETAWMAAPAILVFMHPLFSDKPRFVWILASLQVCLFGLLLKLRMGGDLPYRLRTDDIVHDGDFALFTFLGFTAVMVCAALLAGRTSVDVLNSQRQLNDALQRQEKALAKANARIIQQQKQLSVEQLTAGIMHEINNPLTFVQTNLTSLERDVRDLLELLRTYSALDPQIQAVNPEKADEIAVLRDALCIDDPDEVIGELLTDTRDGLDRVQRIIHDLRVFTRLDEAERKSVRLREGIESTVKILERKFAEREIRLEQDLADLPPIEIFAALCNQVILNLLQNALDACSPGGTVRVRTSLSGDMQVIEVEDDGPGVPEAIRQRIFDPFFTTKDVGEGTGLGLSLSMDIIKKHGGEMTVDTGALGGALFRISLPVDAAGDR
ncbi:MAG: HAMP domain-containing histidine kinase [Myxococcales bacterium]|nr:HAMP domain-containing histidine kinase [Myxococcales bacterium]